MMTAKQVQEFCERPHGSGRHWVVYDQYDRHITGQMLYRNGTNAQKPAIQIGWAFDLNPPNDPLNKRRGDFVESAMRASAPKWPVYRRDTDCNSYVGFLFEVPASPTSAFWSDVAEAANWAIDKIDLKKLDTVK